MKKIQIVIPTYSAFNVFLIDIFYELLGFINLEGALYHIRTGKYLAQKNSNVVSRRGDLRNIKFVNYFLQSKAVENEIVLGNLYEYERQNVKTKSLELYEVMDDIRVLEEKSKDLFSILAYKCIEEDIINHIHFELEKSYIMLNQCPACGDICQKTGK